MPDFRDETIHIVNLRVSCIIGVNPEERVREQPLVINASMRAYFGPASVRDDLTLTLNYSEVAQEIRTFARQGQFLLLETLARRLSRHLAGKFDLWHLELHVRKPEAIADSDGAAVSLTVQRPQPPRPRIPL